VSAFSFCAILIFGLKPFLIFIVASVVFMTKSIESQVDAVLDNMADFTIEKMRGGKVVDMPSEWIDEFLALDGVAKAQGRIYGRYYYEQKEQYFMVYGIDFFDPQISKTFQKMFDSIDVDRFLKRDNMIIGQGVKKFLDKREYLKYYIFRPPNRSKKRLYIYDVLKPSKGFVGDDVVLMSMQNARDILGVKDGYVSDVVLEIPNKKEWQTIYNKIITSHFDLRVITKDDMVKYYRDIFNFRGGFFISLYIFVILTFLLIVYQRYSIITTSDAKEIKILRAMGWSAEEIIRLKLFENFIVVFFAYIFGVMFAMLYVFMFDAPFFREILFLKGYLDIGKIFYPSVNISSFVLIFTAFVVPFLLSILIPIWRLVSDDRV